MIDPANRDIVHHLLMYECSPTAVFDDNNLPDDICDNIYNKVGICTSNIATGWAVGGDEVSFRSNFPTYEKSYLNRSLNSPQLVDIQLAVMLM